MMKRYLIAALALATTLPVAVNVQAQDDDIYFSKKAHKKATTDAIYAETAADEWSTDANNDWDLDAYNRRGSEALIEDTTLLETPAKEEKLFSFEVVDKNGKSTKLFTDKDTFKGADIEVYKVKGDTLFLYEQYYYTDLIRRFYNPYFGYYRYCPWYDVAYYDPFYWDYCYYDPWWYVTPSFGFHWGSWYGGWSYGYYTGWYGGWYSPYYSPLPHYHHFHCCDGPYYNVMGGGYAGSHRGSSRNNFGGHFAHRGGWRGDGGNSRMSSAGSNRSYRASNGARTVRSTGNTNLAAGPSLRGRNTTNGRLANSNMRSTSGGFQSSTGTAPVSRSSRNNTMRQSSGSFNQTASVGNNSDYRRRDAGMKQSDNGSSVIGSRQQSSGTRQGTTNSRPKNWGFSGGHSATRYGNSGYSNTTRNSSPSNSGSSSRSSSSSNSSYTRSSSSSYSSPSYSSGSSSSYSSGGSSSSHSHGGGSHAGRR